MENKDIKQLLESNDIDWFVLNRYINEEYDSLIIPEAKWDLVSQALYNEVGDAGWKYEYDY